MALFAKSDLYDYGRSQCLVLTSGTAFGRKEGVLRRRGNGPRTGLAKSRSGNNQTGQSHQSAAKQTISKAPVQKYLLYKVRARPNKGDLKMATADHQCLYAYGRHSLRA